MTDRAAALRAAASGALVVNAVPHVASAVTGRRHLTPVAGRRSGPTINLLWGLGSAVAGYRLLGRPQPRDGDRWDTTLVAFEAGAAAWGVWSVLSEAVLRTSVRAAAGEPQAAPRSGRGGRRRMHPRPARRGG